MRQGAPDPPLPAFFFASTFFDMSGMAPIISPYGPVCLTGPLGPVFPACVSLDTFALEVALFDNGSKLHVSLVFY